MPTNGRNGRGFSVYLYQWLMPSEQASPAWRAPSRPASNASGVVGLSVVHVCGNVATASGPTVRSVIFVRVRAVVAVWRLVSFE